MKKINFDFSGEKNGNCKLTSEEVKKIRELYAEGTYTFEALALLTNVSKSQVYRIVKSRSWV